jgi:TonB family protein
MQPARDPELDALLGKLDKAEQHRPWFATLGRDVKDTLFPVKLPPLELTSQPIPIKDIWGFSEGHRAHSGLGSVAIHVGVIALALWLGTNSAVQQQVKNLTAVDISAYIPTVIKPAPKSMGGGGGGGDRSPLPASAGKLPRIAPKQFVPPTVIRRNENPKLELEPTIIAQLDAPLPKLDSPLFGDPLAHVGPPSNGQGKNGGIGNGDRGGVGSGKGPGYGPGDGGNFGGDTYRIGGGVLSPVPIFKPDPEYSEEARKAKFQGSVRLQIIVDASGNPRDIRVIRPLGLGLDEKAIEAVMKWRFRAGTKDGKAVAVVAMVDVNFRLL